MTPSTDSEVIREISLVMSIAHLEASVWGEDGTGNNDSDDIL